MTGGKKGHNIKKKIKVLWLCPYPINEFSDNFITINDKKKIHPASWIYNLSNELSKSSEIELHILTESKAVYENHIFKSEGIYFNIIKSPYLIPFINRSIPSFFRIHLITNYWFSKIKILKYINRINPDIIHSHGTEAQYSLIALESKYKTVISIQGLMNLYNNYINLYDKKVLVNENFVLKKGRYFGSRTAWVDDYIKSVNPEAIIFKMQEAMNPVFFGEIKYNKDKNILFVGALEKRKGIDYLIEAFNKVSKKHKDYRLLLIGSGEKIYIENLKTQLRNFGIIDKVDFLGHKNSKEIKFYHDCSKIFVFPTLIDNSPNSVAEAMVSGLPVIASRVGGIPSMIQDYKNGILVPSRNYKVLAEKIIEIIEDKELRNKIKINAFKKAKRRYNPKKVAESTIKNYKKILRLK